MAVDLLRATEQQDAQPGVGARAHERVLMLNLFWKIVFEYNVLNGSTYKDGILNLYSVIITDNKITFSS
jgi:hypothetical protein